MIAIASIEEICVSSYALDANRMFAEGIYTPNPVVWDDGSLEPFVNICVYVLYEDSMIALSSRLTFMLSDFIKMV